MWLVFSACVSLVLKEGLVEPGLGCRLVDSESHKNRMLQAAFFLIYVFLMLVIEKVDSTVGSIIRL